MNRIIAVANQAGGVGKTTLVRDIGYELAAGGKRVLLVDLDPQASLTIFLGLDPWNRRLRFTTQCATTRSNCRFLACSTSNSFLQSEARRDRS